MLKFKYSVPGKVILFGEHAVVYGCSAVSVAITKRMSATCTYKPVESESVINFTFDGEKKTYYIEKIKAEKLNDNSPEAKLKHVMLKAFGEIKRKFALDISIESEFSLGSGMGGSAALCVLMCAISEKICDREINNDIILKNAIELEKIYHGNSSGIDPATVVFGKAIAMENKSFKKIDLPNIKLLIVETGKQHDTVSAVKSVRTLKEKYPTIYDPIIQSMGSVAKTFLEESNDNKTSVIKDLIPVAHNLLCSFGLSCPEADNIVSIANVNNMCAKITGAGKGGIVIVAGDDIEKKQVLFKDYKTLLVEVSPLGLQEESIL